MPNDSGNLDDSAAGASIPNNGSVIDSSPQYGNPAFANPSAGNYVLGSTSAAFSQINFPVLPVDQGPLALPASLPN